MHPERIIARGDFAARTLRNFSRLEQRRFTPDVVFSNPDHYGGWPADMEGRVMLAITLLGRLTKREPAYLSAYLDQLESSLNERGYRGAVLDDAADEQSLSGHNWLVRALLEHHLWRGDDRSLRLASQIVENLYLPLRGKYVAYPIDPAARTMDGQASGNLDGHLISGWKTSTDIGCAFISMDALSQFFELTGDTRVAALLDEMIRVFREIDLVGLSMQTHATLSATRGILRYHRANGDPSLLQLAARVFDLYIANGMSECYANHNWFGRALWTEPCAIVDSYIVAMDLFELTGDPERLDTANRILYTALWHAQRKNGGFGCDSCPGTGDDPMILRQVVEEAHWCCSMRGAEGLYSAATRSVLAMNDELILANLIEGSHQFGDATITLRTGFPYDGDVRITVEGTLGCRTMRIYTPSATPISHTAIVNEKPMICSTTPHLIGIKLPQGSDIKITLKLDIPLDIRPALAQNTPKNLVSFWHGVLMLGMPGDAPIPLPDPEHLYPLGRARYALDDLPMLEPLCDQIDAALVSPMQVLFPIGNR